MLGYEHVCHSLAILVCRYPGASRGVLPVRSSAPSLQRADTPTRGVVLGREDAAAAAARAADEAMYGPAADADAAQDLQNHLSSGSDRPMRPFGLPHFSELEGGVRPVTRGAHFLSRHDGDVEEVADEEELSRAVFAGSPSSSAGGRRRPHDGSCEIDGGAVSTSVLLLQEAEAEIGMLQVGRGMAEGHE